MDSLRNRRAHVGTPADKTYKAPDVRVQQAFGPDSRERNVHFTELLLLKKTKASHGQLLGTERNESSSDAGVTPGPAPSLAQWFRAETPPEPALAPLRSLPQLAPHQRVLVSTNGVASHARIEIAGGTLAGSQIHLTAAGDRIEAQLLTGDAASRQTLIAAMDAVRGNLRARGLLIAGARSVHRFADGELREDAPRWDDGPAPRR